MKSKSIAEKITELSNPGANAFHPDIEDSINETSARVEDFTEDDTQSRNRRDLKQKRIPAAFAFDGDKKYAGKRVSRRDLKSEDESESDIDGSALSAFQSKLQVHSRSEEEEEEGNASDESGVEGSDTDERNEDEEASDMDGVEEELSGDEEESEGESGNESEGMDEEGFQAVSKTGGVSEAEKGRILQAQFGIYDQLIESRIKLQKALMATNKLPQAASWSDFVTPLDNDGRAALKRAQNSLKDLLDSLLELQGQLYVCNSKTKGVVGKAGSKAPKEEESDEEIPSDTEDEAPPEDSEYEPLKKRMKLQQYTQTIQDRHKKFLGYRNEMIQYWNQRTKLASGKLSSKSFQKFEQSTLKQIELILADRDRLVKRTQVKRSAYVPLGAVEDDQKTDDNATVEKEDGFDYDSEIFDDDDFYHQMLREFVERKTSDSSDAAALGRQLLEIQKLRSKGKRKVDTKASKGRRIRYDVHQKLVNFMPPINKGTMSEEVTNDLFDSLFGKRIKAS